MDINKWRELSKKFDFLSDFVDGIALVELDGKSFHVNEEGEPIYSERYNFGVKFSEGFGSVIEDGKCYFINKEGKKVFGRSFTDVGNFKDGVAFVCVGSDKWVKINTKGEEVSRHYDGSEIF